MSFNETIEDASYRTIYEPPPAASRMAGVRFGNTQDVVVLFEGDSDEISEYIRGLIFIAAVTFVIFMTWGILICVFMCLGHERVNYFSGRPFQRERPNDFTLERAAKEEQRQQASGNNKDNNTQQPQRKDLYKRGDPWRSEPTRMRLVFLFSGVVVITFAILLVTRGLTQLQTTVDTVNKSAKTMQKITAEGREIIDEGLRSLRSRATNVRTTLLVELDRDIFCPADTSMENSDVGREVRKHVDQVVSLLGDLEDFQENTLNDFDESLLSVQDAAKSVEDTSENTDFIGWKSMIVLLPYTIIAALLMSATVMAFFDVSFPVLNRLINWILLPLFIIMTVGACVLASMTAIAAGMNSDFCLPGGDESASPDENVVGIMLAEGYVEDEFELRMVKFFVEQCVDINTPEDPFQSLRTYLPDMRDNQAALNEVIKTLRADDQLAELSLYCNREFDALDAQLDNMSIILSVLIKSLERLLDLISCERIVPIYTDTIYDASCAYSTKALFWIFMCCIILGTFGFVMITLRASYKLTIEEPRAPVVTTKKANRESEADEADENDNDRGYDASLGHGTRESPVQATPYRTEPETPPSVVQVDENADEVFTAFTGNFTNESDPMGRPYTPRSPRRSPSPRRTPNSNPPRSPSPRRRVDGDSQPSANSPRSSPRRRMDDDAVTREKIAQAIDVD